MLTTEQSDKLANWRQAKESLDHWKQQEAAWRTEVVLSIFPNAAEGTNTLEIGNGWKLKLVAKTNYKIDNFEGKATGIQDKLDNPYIFKWEPKLSISEYKRLSDAHKAIVDEVLTTSPGMPALELVEPKA